MKPLLPRHSNAGLLLLAIAVGQAATAQGEPAADYKPVHVVSGTIRVCGSPQMGDLLLLYEHGFAQRQPAVHFENDLKSTITAVAGVYSDSAEIGLLGREIWPAEAKAFESAQGRPPYLIDIATGSFDVPKATFALMIVVPNSNPIASLSMGQLERIFADGDQRIRRWGELGLRGEWANRPIHLYGFSADNDKSRIFAQLVFHAGERQSPSLHEFANTTLDAGQLIVEAVADDPYGIGISNVHYSTPKVKALALSTLDHTAPITPTREKVEDRTYPLTRAVYMVVNADASHPPDAAVLEFLRYVLSRQGQQAVAQDGNYLPLPSPVANRQLKELSRISR